MIDTGYIVTALPNGYNVEREVFLLKLIMFHPVLAKQVKYFVEKPEYRGEDCYVDRVQITVI